MQEQENRRVSYRNGLVFSWRRFLANSLLFFAFPSFLSQAAHLLRGFCPLSSCTRKTVVITVPLAIHFYLGGKRFLITPLWQGFSCLANSVTTSSRIRWGTRCFRVTSSIEYFQVRRTRFFICESFNIFFFLRYVYVCVSAVCLTMCSEETFFLLLHWKFL